VPNLGNVNFLGGTTIGILFNGTDTYTITQAGVYVLHCILNISAESLPDNTFVVLLNEGTGTEAETAPSSNSGTSGQISVVRVGIYSVGDTISIRNHAPNRVPPPGSDSVELVEADGILGSAGHFSLYRIADGAV
jgi:hypothetical protein